MPGWLTFIVLALAAYRLTRLAGWDDFPLAAKIRARVTRETWIREVSYSGIVNEVTVKAGDPPFNPQLRPMGSGEVELPGKTPDSNVEDVRVAYGRPMLAHLIHCPFCVGFWISLAVWVAWLAWGDVVYALAPFAISGAVGLIAKNLDA